MTNNVTSPVEMTFEEKLAEMVRKNEVRAECFPAMVKQMNDHIRLENRVRVGGAVVGAVAAIACGVAVVPAIITAAVGDCLYLMFFRRS